jgi:hypothetical protein
MRDYEYRKHKPFRTVTVFEALSDLPAIGPGPELTELGPKMYTHTAKYGPHGFAVAQNKPQPACVQ